MWNNPHPGNRRATRWNAINPHAVSTLLFPNDPVVQALSEQLDLPPLASTGDVFHDLMSCIVEQQIHYRSTKKIFAKALERAGLERLTLENFDAFEADGLAPLALSTAKLETVLRAVEHFSGPIPTWNTLSDNEVRAWLKYIPGIGPWTQDMILLYTLERPNVFPVDDYHLKQILTSRYALNPKARLRAHMLDVAARWDGQSSLAVRYLLESKRVLRG